MKINAYSHDLKVCVLNAIVVKARWKDSDDDTYHAIAGEDLAALTAAWKPHASVLVIPYQPAYHDRIQIKLAGAGGVAAWGRAVLEFVTPDYVPPRDYVLGDGRGSYWSVSGDWDNRASARVFNDSEPDASARPNDGQRLYIEPAPDFPITVAIYLVDRAYGGPEEGGWYYTCGEPCADQAAHVRRFANEDAAAVYMALLNDTVCKEMNQGRRSINSVLSQGEYQAHFSDGAPAAFPAERPHYE